MSTIAGFVFGPFMTTTFKRLSSTTVHCVNGPEGLFPCGVCSSSSLLARPSHHLVRFRWCVQEILSRGGVVGMDVCSKMIPKCCKTSVSKMLC